MNITDFPNIASFEAFKKCERYLMQHKNILVSVSGGSDSDIMLDLIQQVLNNSTLDFNCNIKYVFFETGWEWQATRDHLDYLENKYDIKIDRVRAEVPVAAACIKYGLPFLSKDISAKLNSLQNNNFDFKNDGYKDYEFLVSKYPKCKSVIKWWCDKKPKGFGISSNKLLKEFLIENPPNFKISARCCDCAKKSPSKKFEKCNLIDLKCLGLRRCEGGVRSTKIKSCFSDNEKDYINKFRPLWWISDKDKLEYKNYFGVKYSDCYEIWGFKRSGCANCPYNSDFENSLKKTEIYEPNLFIGCNNLFGKSYNYTRQYREFKSKKNKNCVQVSLFDECYSKTKK